LQKWAKAVYLLRLFDVEVALSSVVGEQIATTKELSCEVDVPLVLEESVVGQLKTQ